MVLVDGQRVDVITREFFDELIASGGRFGLWWGSGLFVPLRVVYWKGESQPKVYFQFDAIVIRGGRVEQNPYHYRECNFYFRQVYGCDTFVHELSAGEFDLFRVELLESGGV